MFTYDVMSPGVVRGRAVISDDGRGDAEWAAAAQRRVRRSILGAARVHAHVADRA